MRKLARSTIVSAAALAAAVGITVSSASATAQQAWSITPGGNFTMQAIQPTFDVPGMQIVCETSDAAGVLQMSSPDGVGIGEIESLDLTVGCSIASAGRFAFSMSGLPWKLNASSYDAGLGVTSGTVTGVYFEINALDVAGCHAEFSGPKDANGNPTPGIMDMRYNNDTGVLSFLDGEMANLTAHNAVCFGLVNENDPTQLQGDFNVKPDQVIAFG